MHLVIVLVLANEFSFSYRLGQKKNVIDDNSDKKKKNSCQQNEHCPAMNTYIVQVRQRRFAQEESKVYLASPGQAHRSPLVYDLCGRLILVVCAVETAKQDSFLEKTG